MENKDDNKEKNNKVYKDENFVKENKFAIIGLGLFISILIIFALFKIDSSVFIMGMLILSAILEIISLIKKESDKIVSIITLFIVTSLLVISIYYILIAVDDPDYTNDVNISQYKNTIEE